MWFTLKGLKKQRFKLKNYDNGCKTKSIKSISLERVTEIFKSSGTTANHSESHHLQIETSGKSFKSASTTHPVDHKKKKTTLMNI